MPNPVIIVDSATGSDSAASGAGPGDGTTSGSALTGTAASVAGTATSVSITDAVDLSGVPVDGSACLYYVDATAGHRNFDSIAAISGSSGAWTVTVANGFTTSTGPFSWAIGGKRASIGSTSSAKLFSNNSAAGDAMPGWAVEMQSGHSETIAATYSIRRGGSTSVGAIMLRGKSGAATLPLITFSNNGTGFSASVGGIVLKDFEIQNSNATKTSSIAIAIGGINSAISIIRIKISHSTNKFWKGFSSNQGLPIFDACEIGYTVSHCIEQSNAAYGVIARECYLHNAGGSGIRAPFGTVRGNLISACNIGVELFNFCGDNLTNYTPNGKDIIENTIDSCVSDGMKLTGTAGLIGTICNNILSNNGTGGTGYGINFSNSSIDLAIIACGGFMAGNVFYNNATDKYTPSPLTSSQYESTSNPQYTNSAGGDFSVGANMKGVRYPSTVSKYGTTNSYGEPGASQRQEAGSGGVGGGIKTGGQL